MSSAVMNNYAAPVNNGYVAKPVPGESVVTQTTVTQTTTAPVYATENKGFATFSSVFGILSGVGYWLGSVLNLTAMALLLRDRNFYYTEIGGLLIAGFSLWFIASLLNWVPNFGGFAKRTGVNGTRSGYHIFNIFANLLAAVSFALFIIGAALWLSRFNDPRYGGEITWIVAGGLWLISMIIRDLGLRYDAMNTYKGYPVLPTTVNQQDTTAKRALGAHISSIWSNALATDGYLIASTLFLLGAIMFAVRGRSQEQDPTWYTSRQFEIAAAVLWLVGSCIVFFAAIAHCVARR
jgi:hypothetical protein